MSSRAPHRPNSGASGSKRNVKYIRQDTATTSSSAAAAGGGAGSSGAHGLRRSSTTLGGNSTGGGGGGPKRVTIASSKSRYDVDAGKHEFAPPTNSPIKRAQSQRQLGTPTAFGSGGGSGGGGSTDNSPTRSQSFASNKRPVAMTTAAAGTTSSSTAGNKFHLGVTQREAEVVDTRSFHEILKDPFQTQVDPLTSDSLLRVRELLRTVDRELDGGGSGEDAGSAGGFGGESSASASGRYQRPNLDDLLSTREMERNRQQQEAEKGNSYWDGVPANVVEGRYNEADQPRPQGEVLMGTGTTTEEDNIINNNNNDTDELRERECIAVAPDKVYDGNSSSADGDPEDQEPELPPLPSNAKDFFEVSAHHVTEVAPVGDDGLPIVDDPEDRPKPKRLIINPFAAAVEEVRAQLHEGRSRMEGILATSRRLAEIVKDLNLPKESLQKMEFSSALQNMSSKVDNVLQALFTAEGSLGSLSEEVLKRDDSVGSIEAKMRAAKEQLLSTQLERDQYKQEMWQYRVCARLRYLVKRRRELKAAEGGSHRSSVTDYFAASIGSPLKRSRFLSSSDMAGASILRPGSSAIVDGAKGGATLEDTVLNPKETSPVEQMGTVVHLCLDQYSALWDKHPAAMVNAVETLHEAIERSLTATGYQYQVIYRGSGAARASAGLNHVNALSAQSGGGIPDGGYHLLVFKDVVEAVNWCAGLQYIMCYLPWDRELCQERWKGDKKALSPFHQAIMMQHRVESAGDEEEEGQQQQEKKKKKSNSDNNKKKKSPLHTRLPMIPTVFYEDCPIPETDSERLLVEFCEHHKPAGDFQYELWKDMAIRMARLAGRTADLDAALRNPSLLMRGPRLKIGLHTGTLLSEVAPAPPHGDASIHVYGSAVMKASKLCGRARGGETLVSSQSKNALGKEFFAKSGIFSRSIPICRLPPASPLLSTTFQIQMGGGGTSATSNTTPTRSSRNKSSRVSQQSDDTTTVASPPGGSAAINSGLDPHLVAKAAAQETANDFHFFDEGESILQVFPSKHYRRAILLGDPSSNLLELQLQTLVSYNPNWWIRFNSASPSFHHLPLEVVTSGHRGSPSLENNGVAAEVRRSRLNKSETTEIFDLQVSSTDAFSQQQSADPSSSSKDAAETTTAAAAEGKTKKKGSTVSSVAAALRKALPPSEEITLLDGLIEEKNAVIDRYRGKLSHVLHRAASYESVLTGGETKMMMSLDQPQLQLCSQILAGKGVTSGRDFTDRVLEPFKLWLKEWEPEILRNGIPGMSEDQSGSVAQEPGSPLSPGNGLPLKMRKSNITSALLSFVFNMKDMADRKRGIDAEEQERLDAAKAEDEDADELSGSVSRKKTTMIPTAKTRLKNFTTYMADNKILQLLIRIAISSSSSSSDDDSAQDLETRLLLAASGSSSSSVLDTLLEEAKLEVRSHRNSNVTTNGGSSASVPHPTVVSRSDEKEEEAIVRIALDMLIDKLTRELLIQIDNHVSGFGVALVEAQRRAAHPFGSTPSTVLDGEKRVIEDAKETLEEPLRVMRKWSSASSEGFHLLGPQHPTSIVFQYIIHRLQNLESFLAALFGRGTVSVASGALGTINDFNYFIQSPRSGMIGLQASVSIPSLKDGILRPVDWCQFLGKQTLAISSCIELYEVVSGSATREKILKQKEGLAFRTTSSFQGGSLLSDNFVEYSQTRGPASGVVLPSDAFTASQHTHSKSGKKFASCHVYLGPISGGSSPLATSILKIVQLDVQSQIALGLCTKDLIGRKASFLPLKALYDDKSNQALVLSHDHSVILKSLSAMNNNSGSSSKFTALQDNLHSVFDSSTTTIGFVGKVARQLKYLHSAKLAHGSVSPFFVCGERPFHGLLPGGVHWSFIHLVQLADFGSGSYNEHREMALYLAPERLRALSKHGAQKLIGNLLDPKEVFSSSTSSSSIGKKVTGVTGSSSHSPNLQGSAAHSSNQQQAVYYNLIQHQQAQDIWGLGMMLLMSCFSVQPPRLHLSAASPENVQQNTGFGFPPLLGPADSHESWQAKLHLILEDLEDLHTPSTLVALLQTYGKPWVHLMYRLNPDGSALTHTATSNNKNRSSPAPPSSAAATGATPPPQQQQQVSPPLLVPPPLPLLVDLLSRMLHPNPTERISIDQVLRHPLLATLEWTVDGSEPILTTLLCVNPSEEEGQQQETPAAIKSPNETTTTSVVTSNHYDAIIASSSRRTHQGSHSLVDAPTNHLLEKACFTNPSSEKQPKGGVNSSGPASQHLHHHSHHHHPYFLRGGLAKNSGPLFQVIATPFKIRDEGSSFDVTGEERARREAEYQAFLDEQQQNEDDTLKQGAEAFADLGDMMRSVAVENPNPQLLGGTMEESIPGVPYQEEEGSGSEDDDDGDHDHPSAGTSSSERRRRRSSVAYSAVQQNTSNKSQIILRSVKNHHGFIVQRRAAKEIVKRIPSLKYLLE